MDPLQSAFVGGWPNLDEFGSEPVAPPKRAESIKASREEKQASPIAPVIPSWTGSREQPQAAAWFPGTIGIMPKAPFVFPAFPENTAKTANNPFDQTWTEGVPDKTHRMRSGVATYSPFRK